MDKWGDESGTDWDCIDVTAELGIRIIWKSYCVALLNSKILG